MRLIMAGLILALILPAGADAKSPKSQCHDRCSSEYRLCMSRPHTRQTRKSCKSIRKRCKSQCRG